MELTLNSVLIEMGKRRKLLVSQIKALKHLGVTQGEIATYLGKSPSAISDLMTTGKDIYSWTMPRINEAIEKLEAYND